MSWRLSASLATTQPCRSWRRQRLSPAASGPMSGTIAPLAGPRRRPPFITPRGTEGRSIRAPSEGLAGILQADAYSGYNGLYDPGREQGAIVSALCWAHARRQFFELADIAANARRGKQAPAISPIALQAVKRIDALLDIERAINGLPADERLRVRQEQSAPLLADLKAWLGDERSRLSRSASVTKPTIICSSAGIACLLPERWPHLLEQQQRRASAERFCAGKKVMALRRFRTRRRSGRVHDDANHVGETQQRRSLGLAR